MVRLSSGGELEELVECLSVYPSSGVCLRGGKDEGGGGGGGRGLRLSSEGSMLSRLKGWTLPTGLLVFRDWGTSTGDWKGGGRGASEGRALLETSRGWTSPGSAILSERRG